MSGVISSYWFWIMHESRGSFPCLHVLYVKVLGVYESYKRPLPFDGHIKGYFQWRYGRKVSHVSLGGRDRLIY